MKQSHKDIIKHYEQCFKKYGDSAKGVDWPNEIDLQNRYTVMSELISARKLRSYENDTLLDFGCGNAMFLKFLQEHERFNTLKYTGLDASDEFIKFCKIKYPNHSFICCDILEDDDNFSKEYDWIVCNGVFTEKRELAFEEMFQYFKLMIRLLFSKARRGLAFNVMSKNVDWERDDLFHLSHDLLSDFLCNDISRNYVIRNDYGLYEYTTYVYKV